MAFFDKISQAGQSAVQKTKDITEIARINSDISDEEKRINGLCLEIGKQYVALHSEDSESALEGLVKAVKESSAKVEALRSQVLTLKGVKKCPSCGGEIPMGSAFCSLCGAEAPKEERAQEPTGSFCPGCGAPVKSGAAFCTQCGTKLG